MPEGRVRNTGSSLKAEYIITDHQGNARISFEDSGTGTAKVVQENSYYAFGMSMTSTMALPTQPNKQLYNGGSEWQNDFADQPDWQQTFYRNYDQTTGRFLAVDPMAEASESMTGYQYAGNNPVMMNDPMGDLTQAQLDEAVAMFNGGPIRSNAYFGPGGNIYDMSDQIAISSAITAGANGGTTAAYEAAAASYNAHNTAQIATTIRIPTGGVIFVQGSSDAAIIKAFQQATSEAFDAWGNAQQGQKNNSEFNVDKSVSWLNNNSHETYIKGVCGKCAKFVRLSLEAGGMKTAGRPVSAKNYGPFLAKKGFEIIGTENYTPLIGDIRVFQPYLGGSIHGHIDMYNGSQWISDFKENNVWPSRGYGKNPDYQIFRWPGD
jgi:RHS repeat-associated protein